MAAIFEEVNITWGADEEGEPVVYTVTPTYRMVQRIEQTVSIASMNHRMASGDPPMSHMAFVLASLLQGAGAEVSAEDVYMELLDIDDQDRLIDLCRIVMLAFQPSSKKSGSQGSGKKAKRKTPKK